MPVTSVTDARDAAEKRGAFVAVGERVGQRDPGDQERRLRGKIGTLVVGDHLWPP